MPTECLSPIRGDAMRITRLNSCGEWVAGPKMTCTTDGYVSVSLSIQYEESEVTRKKNAAGRVWINDRGRVSAVVTQVDAEINFMGIDPDMYNIMSGHPLVLDRAGDPVGIRIGGDVKSNWALEVWTDLANTDCEDGLTPYGYLLLPWLDGARIGDLSVEEAAMDLSVSSSTRGRSKWGVGPYAVDLHDGEETTDPPVPGGLLEPIGVDDHLDLHKTLVPPPTAFACGATALVPIAA